MKSSKSQSGNCTRSFRMDAKNHGGVVSEMPVVVDREDDVNRENYESIARETYDITQIGVVNLDNEAVQVEMKSPGNDGEEMCETFKFDSTSSSFLLNVNSFTQAEASRGENLEFDLTTSSFFRKY